MVLIVTVAAAGCGSDAEVTHWVLPTPLAEISGMAYHDESLLVHDDERGDIYRIGLPTATTGPVIDLMYRMGEPGLRADFEGITVHGSNVYVTTSRGMLFRFPVANVGVVIPERVDSGLEEICEVEGLDSIDTGLLLACKTHYTEPGDVSVIYHFDPVMNVLDRWLVVGPQRSLSAIDHYQEGIALLAAKQHLLWMVGEAGETIATVDLDPRRHPQPEGIAVTPAGDIWIADEDAGGGRLTVYRAGGG